MRQRFGAVLIAVMVAVTALGSAPLRARGASGFPARYLVLIVMDGFRPDYMSLAPMRHVRALMRSGMAYKRAWVGQLETETPTGHATIVTGTYPKKHGVVGFGWRAPNGSYVWMPTDLRQLKAGLMESLIEAGGAPTISDLMHRKYPGSKSASMSGEKYYAADAMGTGADYILYSHALKRGMEVLPIGQHVPPPSTRYQTTDTRDDAYPWLQDKLVGSVAVRLLATIRPQTMLVNLPGSDIEGHLTGGIVDKQDMRNEARHADAAIGAIVDAYKRAGLYSRTLFVVTADHGMVPNTHVVPIKRMYGGIRATGAPTLEDDLLTTAGYVFLRDPADAAVVASRLSGRHFPWVEGALYRSPAGSGYAFHASHDTETSLGPAVTRAYLDLANTLAAPSGPEVVLPYREDTMGLTVRGSGPHWGNHGGLSWRVQHIPLVISGPGVAHSVSWFPAQLVDIAPTIERLLDLPIPAAVDGVVLADALKRAQPDDVAAQRGVAARRSQDVRALMQHSRAQNGIALGE